MTIPKINQISLSGRISNDLELRYTAKGDAIMNFTIAVDKSFKDDKGEWQNNAIFLTVTAFKSLAEKLNENAKKGTPVYVTGKIDIKEYTNKDNVTVKQLYIWADTIQILEKKESQQTNFANDDVAF